MPQRTEQKKVMSRWRKAQLGEYISVKHGFAFKGEYFTEEPNENVLVTPGNFSIGGGFKADKFKYYNGQVPENYVLTPGDVIVTMTDLSKKSDTLGYPAKVPGASNHKYLHNQRIGLVKFKSSEIDKDFLYYLMCTSNYQQSIVNSASGSTVRHTSPTRIESYEITLPPVADQQAIAAILTSLDSKIDLLQEQNKTLEAIAQTLFKEWFVDFNFPNEQGKPYQKNSGAMINSGFGKIPTGWRVGKLSEEFTITMGQSPSGSSYNDQGEGMIFFQGRAEFQDRFPKVRLYTTQPKRTANQFDVLVSVRAPVGSINLAGEKCCIGRGLAAVSSKFKSYALYKVQSLSDTFDKFDTEGTVFGSINKSSFENINVIIPKTTLVESFEKIVSSIDAKFYHNYLQMRSLSTLRDLILPRLICGEMRVLP